MALVSFAADIKPLFRPVDVAHMNVHGIKLDDYKYMSDPANNHANAEAVQRTVAHRGRSTTFDASRGTLLDGRAIGAVRKVADRRVSAVRLRPNRVLDSRRRKSETAI